MVHGRHKINPTPTRASGPYSLLVGGAFIGSVVVVAGFGGGRGGRGGRGQRRQRVGRGSGQSGGGGGGGGRSGRGQ